ncbi:MAG: hypothetical protein KBG15_03505 [Kofleriaceae bacterium]|nr:hypothetical protein [Kofleriaceae bacterium]
MLRPLLLAATTTLALATSMLGRASAEPCPVFTPSPEILQRSNSVLPGGAGVVVRSGYEMAGTTRSDVDASLQPTWNFVRSTRKGAAKIATTMEPLAPGLTRYVPAGGTGTIAVTVAGKLHRVTLTSASAKHPVSPLPAPTLARITMELRPVRGGGRPNAVATATLQDRRPPAVVAVIVYGIDDKGVATPRSFAKVYDDALAMQVYTFSTRNCEPPVPSTIASNIGDQVALAWVDELGRVSPRSAPLKIIDAAGLGRPSVPSAPQK